MAGRRETVRVAFQGERGAFSEDAVITFFRDAEFLSCRYLSDVFEAVLTDKADFGVVPVAVATQQPLDVVAAMSEDGRTLTIGVVNPTLSQLDLPLSIDGVELAGPGKRWQIAGDDPGAYNEPGQAPKVRIETTTVDNVSDQLSVPACSVTLFALELK